MLDAANPPVPRSSSVLISLLVLYMWLGIIVDSFSPLGSLLFVAELGLFCIIIFVMLGLRITITLNAYFIGFAAVFSFFFIIGGLPHANADTIVVLLQVLYTIMFAQIVYVIIQTEDQIEYLWRQFLYTAAIVATLGYLLNTLGLLEPYLHAGRMSIVGQNANYTGYFFATTFVSSVILAIEKKSIFFTLLALPMGWAIVLSGSFGALAAVFLSITAYIIMTRNVIGLTVLLLLPVLVMIFGLSNIFELLRDGQLRGLNRLGIAGLAWLEYGLDSSLFGSAAERLHLQTFAFENISETWHANLLSGHGFELMLLELGQHVHSSFVNLWHNVGLASALIYSAPFYIVFFAMIRSRKDHRLIGYMLGYMLVILMFLNTTPLLYSRSFLFPFILISIYFLKFHAHHSRKQPADLIPPLTSNTTPPDAR